MEKPQYTAAHLKGMNRHVVYDFIRERGATSKAQIVKETGISPPTVIKIVSYLVERGLVVEAGEGAAGGGRRPQLLAINGPGRFSAVFALEGSFLSMGLVDISGRVLHRQKTRTAQDFGAFLAEVRDGLVSSLLHAAGADPARLIGVGVTLPGTYDPARRVLDYAPAIGVFGPVEIGPWMDGMTQKFGVPVYVENDTNAQCIASMSFAVRGTLCMFRRERAWVRGSCWTAACDGAKRTNAARSATMCFSRIISARPAQRAAWSSASVTMCWSSSSPWTVFPAAARSRPRFWRRWRPR